MTKVGYVVNEIKAKADKRTIITLVLLFFISRAFLPGGIIPFGMAAFAALITVPGFNRSVLEAALYGVSVIAGTMTLGNTYQTISASLTATTFYLLLKMIPADHGKIPYSVKSGLLLSGCNFISSIIVLGLGNGLWIDVLLLMIQNLVIFSSYYIVRNVLIGLQDREARRMISNEELSCIAMVMILVVMGLPAINFYSISLRNVCAVTIIMLFSARGGLGTGAASGVVVGILLNASGGRGLTDIVCMYALCGFLAGLLNRYGKIGVILGFIFGNIFLASIVGGTSAIIEGMYHICFGTILFLFIPGDVLSLIKAPAHNKGRKDRGIAQEETQKNIMGDKISSFAAILKNAAETFDNLNYISVSSYSGEKGEIANRICNQVCKNCNLRNVCWEKGYRGTYNGFENIIESINEEGYCPAGSVPARLKEVCPNIEKVISEARAAWEVQRMEKLWRRRVSDCRRMVSLQLKGISDVIENMAREMVVPAWGDEKIRRKIMKSLEDHDIKYKELNILPGRNGAYSVSLLVKSIPSTKELDKLSSIISNVFGKEYYADEDNGSMEPGGVWYHISFYEKENFRVRIGIAERPCQLPEGDGINGDTLSYIKLGEGLVCGVISDGMGVGIKASRQSQAVVRMIESFAKSGLSKRAAISMVSLLMETASERELSATVDMVLVDRYSGHGSFLKLGAVPSYIRRENSVERVAPSEQLPAGLSPVSGIREYPTSEKQLRSGDFIVICSDGISECFGLKEQGEADYMRFIDDYCMEFIHKEDAAQIIADAILDRAMVLAGGCARDDMSVMVMEIE